MKKRPRLKKTNNNKMTFQGTDHEKIIKEAKQLES